MEAHSLGWCAWTGDSDCDGPHEVAPHSPDGPPICPQILKDGVEEEQLAGTAALDPRGPDGPPR